jgi:hypothetical protein
MGRLSVAFQSFPSTVAAPDVTRAVGPTALEQPAEGCQHDSERYRRETPRRDHARVQRFPVAGAVFNHVEELHRAAQAAGLTDTEQAFIFGVTKPRGVP